MVPYVLGLFVMFMVYLFMRNFAKSEYSGITLSLDITKIVRGFLVSITAPLPGVTFLFRGGAAISLNGFLRNIQLLDIIIVLIYIYLCLYLFKIRDKDSFKDSGRIEIFILGSLFVCGPAGLMAVSEKYQALPWGNGYLVIIFQYFGWGCIAAWTIMKVLQVHPHIIRYIFMFCIIAGGSGLILLNQQDIRWTIREKEIQEPSTSAGFDRSLRAAVMSGMASRAGIDPDKDLILMQDEFYNGYARSSVFAEMTGRVYQCMRISEIQSIDTGGREVYVLTNGEGWVIIGHVERLDTLDTKAIVDKLWIYCDNNSDRLLIRSKDDFKFWDLYAANHIENLGQGTLFLFDQITEDAISMEPVVYQTYRLGTRFQFTDTQMNKGVYWKNSLPERERKYTWTDGKKNGMKMELEMAEHFQKIKAEMDIVMVYGNGQQVNINVNGERVFSQRVDHAGKIEFEFAKPANNHVEIDFEFPDAESPLEQGESNDSRELAIAVGEMVLEAID